MNLTEALDRLIELRDECDRLEIEKRGAEEACADAYQRLESHLYQVRARLPLDRVVIHRGRAISRLDTGTVRVHPAVTPDEQETDTRG